MRAACGADFPMIVKADSNGCGDLPALLQLYECCGVDGAEVSGIDFNRRAGCSRAGLRRRSLHRVSRSCR